MISTHKSKSVLLPVYQFAIERDDVHIIFTMRYNFHDWKISVDSNVDIAGNFNRLFDEKAENSDCYFEGFSYNLVYGCYSENKKKFSVCIYDTWQVYTFFWILNQNLFDKENN